MPRDVQTRWNSTYDMLVFAIAYRKAINKLTGDKSAGLRKYELSDEEWKVAKQLCALLKVHDFLCTMNDLDLHLLGLQRCHVVLLSRHTKSGNGHPRDGSY